MTTLSNEGGLVAVCSARPRAQTQSVKGHQWWARDVYHLRSAADPQKTLCGRDCSEWLVIGQIEAVDDSCCKRCRTAATPDPTLSNKAAEIVAQARAAASKVDGWSPELASILCDAEREIRGLAPSNKVVDTQELSDLALSCLFLLSDESCLDAEDPLLNRYSDEQLDTDPINECFDQDLLVQQGNEDNFIVSITDKGRALVSALRTTQCSGDTQELADEVAQMRRVADDWRRPGLEQIEGPNDLKIYGGTIADDIDRWADMLSALRTTHSPSDTAVEVEAREDCPNCDMPLAKNGGCYYPECNDPQKPRAALPSDKTVELLREAREQLRQTANALACADKNDPAECIADNGMTVWDGMRSEHERLWPRSTELLARIDSHLGEMK